MLHATLPLALRERVVPARQLVIAAGVAAAAAAVVAGADSWTITGALAGAFVLAALGLFRPAVFVGLLLLARPMLDEWGGNSVGPTNVPGLVGVALVFLAALLVITRPRALKPPPAAAFLVVVLVTAGGSAIALADLGDLMGNEPIAEIVRVLSLLAVYILAANLISTPERVRWLFVAVALSGIGPGIWGSYELVTGTADQFTQSIEASRVSGPFVGPVPLGMFLTLSAILLIGLPRHWLPISIRVLALAPILTALVASYSRSGWAAFLIALILISLWGNKWLLPAGVTLIVAVLVGLPSVQDRVLPQEDYASEETTYGSYRFRIENWQALLEKAADKPLLGHGTKTTVYINERRPGTSQLGVPGQGFEAHNSFVRAALEGGALLLLAWVAFALVLAGRFRRLTSRRWSLYGPARVVAALWVAFALVGATSDDPGEVTSIVLALFALTGALEGAYFHLRSETGRTSEGAGPDHPLTLSERSDVRHANA